MKKSIFLLFIFAAAFTMASAQTKPVLKTKTPIKTTSAIKLKGTVPYLVRGSSQVRQIVPANASNPSFRLQRGSVPYKRNASPPSNPTAPNEEGRYCTESLVSEEKGDEKRIVLGNQNDKIYPGAIYYESAILSGAYNAPALQLKPYNITTDLFSAAFTESSIVQVEPTLGGVNNGLSTLMRRSMTTKNAARVVPEVKILNSSEQLAFEIGANFSGYGADLNASFNYMKSTRKNVFLARLTQVYFSVMLNVADGKQLVDNNPLPNNLVYVNKVNYGRLGYIFIASDSSREAIQAALDFTYSSGNVGGGVNARLNYERTVSSMQISGFFFGGDAANTISLNSPNQLQAFDDYVQNGLRLDPNVAPVAVSYELKYLNDNSTAATRSTTTYTERQCTPARGINLQLHNVAIEDVHGGDCSYAWGKISVEIWETNRDRVPLNRIWSGTLWEHNAAQPNRTVINYADIRAGNTLRDEIMNIPNGSRNINLNPILVNEGRIMFRFFIEINTRHKDNDFAALGEHGMRRVEVVEKSLNEIFASREAIATDSRGRYKYGTFKAGRFCSNTDRVHCFYALFSVTESR
ncbi:MAG: thiol-activated cytolysin family protein [Chitinophagales bacterium]|nr:thiol-activated cytolysin family protein [Chitinophagales bacterium]